MATRKKNISSKTYHIGLLELMNTPPFVTYSQILQTDRLTDTDVFIEIPVALKIKGNIGLIVNNTR